LIRIAKYSSIIFRPGAGSYSWRRAIFTVLLAVLFFSAFLFFHEANFLEKGHPAMHIDLEGNWLGQTFVAQKAGLEGIEIFCGRPALREPGTFLFCLYASPDKKKVLRRSSSGLSKLFKENSLIFRFEPFAESRNRYFYFEVFKKRSLPNSDSLSFSARPYDTYMDGSGYRDGSPVDAQLIFQPVYDFRYVFWELVRRSARSVPAVIGALLMLFLPGSCLLVWSGCGESLDFPERTAFTAGLSLSCYPILMLYAELFSLRFSTFSFWLVMCLFFVGTALGLKVRRKSGERPVSSVFPKTLSPEHVLLAAIVAISTIVRFYIVRNLPAPLWADSHHHTILTRLIVENGNVPNSWLPYALAETVDYHFGFHAMTAFFHWATQLPLLRCTLLFGQLLNILVAPMSYLLAKRLTGSAWAGVFAALMSGLLSKYPMFYVNWGRYTQLAGQIILPCLLVAAWMILERKEKSKSAVLSALF
jgi:hypothetical protein